MNLLLDTHIWLWWTDGDALLPESFKAAITDESNDVFVSSVVAWELTIKFALGKLALPGTPNQWIPMIQSKQRFRQLPISTVHAVTVSTLPMFDDHKDPFDRLHIAQALSEDSVIVTADPKFKRHPGKVLA